MAEPSEVKFTLATKYFDVSLLPRDAREHGTPAFRDAVTAYLNDRFERFGGSISTQVQNDTIEVSWKTDRQAADALAQIIDELKRGNYPAAITLLRLFLSGLPNDANLLYNLGMALSDTGKLDDAINHLRRAVTLAPDFTNARVALGIALQRKGENEDAMRILAEAASRDAQNGWAQRSLGACLLNAGKVEEAEERLRHAMALDGKDQLAVFGLGEALAKLGRFQEADDAYKQSIDIDTQTKIADAARVERLKIASRQSRK
jgi:Flp pilus assembly protein TadD